MLNRVDTYAGLVSFNDVVVESDEALLPRVWDEETFAAVLRERRRRSQPRGYNRHGSRPLAGVAVCRRCGGPMYSDNYHGYAHGPKLYCGNHYRRVRPACHPNFVHESILLDALADYLAEYADPQRIAELVVDQDQSAGLRLELDDAQKALSALQEQRRRLGLAYAEGVMDLDVYSELDVDIGDRLAVAQDQVAELERLIEAMPDAAQRAAALEELSVSFRELLRENDPHRVATLLQNAGVWIAVERDGDERIIEIGIG
jgi:hypothetical protein